MGVTDRNFGQLMIGSGFDPTGEELTRSTPTFLGGIAELTDAWLCRLRVLNIKTLLSRGMAQRIEGVVG